MRRAVAKCPHICFTQLHPTMTKTLRVGVPSSSTGLPLSTTCRSLTSSRACPTTGQSCLSTTSQSGTPLYQTYKPYRPNLRVLTCPRLHHRTRWYRRLSTRQIISQQRRRQRFRSVETTLSHPRPKTQRNTTPHDKVVSSEGAC